MTNGRRKALLQVALVPVRLPALLRSRAYSSASGQVLRATWGALQNQAVRSAWCVTLVQQDLDAVCDLPSRSLMVCTVYWVCLCRSSL